MRQKQEELDIQKKEEAWKYEDGERQVKLQVSVATTAIVTSAPVTLCALLCQTDLNPI